MHRFWKPVAQNQKGLSALGGSVSAAPLFIKRQSRCISCTYSIRTIQVPWNYLHPPRTRTGRHKRQWWCISCSRRALHSLWVPSWYTRDGKRWSSCRKYFEITFQKQILFASETKGYGPCKLQSRQKSNSSIKRCKLTFYCEEDGSFLELTIRWTFWSVHKFNSEKRPYMEVTFVSLVQSWIASTQVKTLQKSRSLESEEWSCLMEKKT